ncbi:DNA-directed RNA polymerase II subunit GRINL1A-like isoform X2 [Physella acuta]|uniref:DNA-directed RNA polymerase II subunit GRINL1A-like isoform X2 n=1 Tax=Physella acuta TaxID=109671 RepID=UPI0027DD0871|nr:DNA-directed RNA polymerase II subunit GRINL1A-like isoform X2 [Physella acuta]
MNLTPDRQGYLGDLMKKTVPELQELLDRLNKILSKRHFLESLPDKGEKTRKSVEHIKQVIDLKQRNSSQKNRLLEPVVECKGYVPFDLKVNKDHTESCMEAKLPILDFYNEEKENHADIEKVENLISKLHDDKLITSGNFDLTTNLQNLSLGGDNVKKPNPAQHVNNYEKIIRKTDVMPAKPKFLPNRTLKSHEIPPPPSSYTHKVTKTVHKEESAATPPDYKYKETKLISVEESVILIEEQRAKNEVLAAEWAAKRLADQLLPKMTSYMPSKVDMQETREMQLHEEKDSDDDSDNEDE